MHQMLQAVQHVQGKENYDDNLGVESDSVIHAEIRAWWVKREGGEQSEINHDWLNKLAKAHWHIRQRSKSWQTLSQR